MDWRKPMAHANVTVDEELLLRREYRSAENRILIQQLQGRLYGQKIPNACRHIVRSTGLRAGCLGRVDRVLRLPTLV